MPENIYLNTFQHHNSRSTETDRQKCMSRGGVCKVVLLSVLFLSLLLNAVFAYLYYTNNTNQLMGCEPVTNNSNLEVNKPSLSCTYKGLPERWVQDKGRFYFFSTNTMDWKSSRRHCQDLGGDLVIINSMEEQDFLAQQINTSNALALHWIGLTDRQTEGTWLWVDNTPLNNKLSWWIFPPDNHEGYDPSGEDCAVLNGYLGGEKWGDISCLNKERSICEIPFNDQC